MILLKPLKVNSNLQVFKFRSELYNLNKINIVKREIKKYEKECNYGYIEVLVVVVINLLVMEGMKEM